MSQTKPVGQSVRRDKSEPHWSHRVLFILAGILALVIIAIAVWPATPPQTPSQPPSDLPFDLGK